MVPAIAMTTARLATASGDVRMDLAMVAARGPSEPSQCAGWGGRVWRRVSRRPGYPRPESSRDCEVPAAAHVLPIPPLSVRPVIQRCLDPAGVAVLVGEYRRVDIAELVQVIRQELCLVTA